MQQLSSTTVIADKGYDSTRFIEQLEMQGCAVIIPARANRKEPREHDTHTYKDRRYVEIFFQKIKRFRRIATRYEKLATTYEAMIVLASVMVWLR